MMPPEPGDQDKTPTYRTTRVETVERVVRRGDKFIPIDERFDFLEKRVGILTIVVALDVLLTLGSNPQLWDALKKLVGW